MGKLLVLLVLVVIAYAWWRSFLAKAARAAGERANPPAARTQLGEQMVSCRRCGVNLPIGEALEVGGVHYCTPEHVRGEGGSER